MAGERTTSEVVLDEGTQVVDLGQFVEVELGHPIAPMRDVGHVSFGLEHPQGLAHGDPTDSQ